ncbi:MAG: methylmalonyl-CoA mutase, partial [Armatimonadetes bacterium]|nr:methylmalonyl-CoA mutase [Armatimonadota bacterium]
VEAGLDVDRFAPTLSFFFAAQMDVLEEVAKFRAARRLWARLIEERFRPKDPRSAMLRFHTQTAGAALTAQQPNNNVARVALQALAAVLGGTQSLHTNARDEALALPTEEAALLALRTQQILAFESGVANTVDPLGGSYYIEALTDRIETEARDLIRQVEEAGGMLAAIERGLVQRMIAEAAYQEARAIESGEKVVVGVNRYAHDEAVTPALLRIDPAAVERQKQRLARVRAERDGGAVERALAGVREAAAGSGPVMEAVLEAVRAYATIGEICDVLRAVFGVYRPVALV